MERRNDLEIIQEEDGSMDQSILDAMELGD